MPGRKLSGGWPSAACGLRAKLMRMKKKLDIDGEKVRRERERRAWTQEQLSERSQIAVRTLRRLEAGRGSLDSLRRVAEALDMEPEESLLPEAPQEPARIPFDAIRVEVSSVLLGEDPQAFLNSFLNRVDSVRRHIASQRGYIMPAVRFRDVAALPSGYRVLLRGVLVAKATIYPGRLLAVDGGDRLAQLRGEATLDPVYGMPGVWIEPDDRPMAQSLGCTVVDTLQLIATHLFYLIKRHSHLLLGLEEVAALLDGLGQPRLVAEVVPGKASLSEVRTILRALLEEGVALSDLARILETIAEHPGTALERVEHVRQALWESISGQHADEHGVIRAAPADAPDLLGLCQSLQKPIVYCPGGSRRRVRTEMAELGARLRAQSAAPLAGRPGCLCCPPPSDPSRWIFLADAEIAPRYRVQLVNESVQTLR